MGKISYPTIFILNLVPDILKNPWYHGTKTAYPSASLQAPRLKHQGFPAGFVKLLRLFFIITPAIQYRTLVIIVKAGRPKRLVLLGRHSGGPRREHEYTTSTSSYPLEYDTICLLSLPRDLQKHFHFCVQEPAYQDS